MMADENRGRLIVIRKGRHPQLPGEEGERHEAVAHPQRVLRITTMARRLLEEVRAAKMDEPGRRRIRMVFQRALAELEELLSEDLRHEMETLVPPLAEAPTKSEALMAQAQLAGWLEGLLHGMEAAVWTQYIAAQTEVQELRRRALRASERNAERESARRYM